MLGNHLLEIKNLKIDSTRNNSIIMMVYLVENWLGKIKAKEEQKLAWITRYQIKEFNFF